MTGPRPFTLKVRSLGPLLVGGHSAPRHGGDRSSARDLLERPVIPASALRGALRIELERLLRGRDGDDAVCSPNVDPGREGEGECTCPVCRLFGSESHGLGTLRLEDAAIEDEATARPVLRTHVGVGRRSGSAVSGHLAFLEGTGSATKEGPLYRARGRLVARSARDTEDDLQRDLENLTAAASALTSLGGGKARGFGWVECTVAPGEGSGAVAASVVPPDLPSGEGITLRLHFEARAPLHFGAGAPLGGFLPARTFAPGSTVRGALAFALLEQGICSPDDERLGHLVAEGSGVTFGGARMTGDRPSATRRRCRPTGHVFDDLVGELVRREAAARGVAIAPRPDQPCIHPACEAVKVQPWHWRAGKPEPRMRVRTRTAINRRTGTSMDRKLYSVEVLEPWVIDEAEGTRERVVLMAEVRGLSSNAAELLAALHGREVWLGGRRSRGMGRCRLTVESSPTWEPEGARRSIEDLTGEVRKAWQQLQAAVGPSLESFPKDGERLVALILDEPWANEAGPEGLDAGPLGPGRRGGLERAHCFLSLGELGRFGAVEGNRFGAPPSVPRGEVPPILAAQPGSTFVYRTSGEVLDQELTSWVELGRTGSGVHRELGWGRFTVRGPELD